MGRTGLAAAVILDQRRLPAALAAIINDSKVLRRLQREHIAAELPAYAYILASAWRTSPRSSG